MISNRDGQVVHDGRDVLARIVGQIASPVRWDLCMETMADLGVTGILEMPPAGTLTGIAKRALKGVETFALKTPDQLDDAREFCAKHGEASGASTPAPTWRMVVSPAKGTFHTSDGGRRALDVLAAGAAIGEVASLRDRTSVTAAHGGQVVEWLVEDGDLVSPGQPLRPPAPRGRQPLMAAISDVPGRPARRASSASAPTGPSRVVPNSEVVDAIDSSDEWIQQRSGIKQRRWADARGDRADDVRRRLRARRSSGPASTPGRSTASSSPPSATCSRPRPSPPRSPTSSAPTRPRRSTSPPPAPASATASRWPPTWSAPAAPATSW